MFDPAAVQACVDESRALGEEVAALSYLSVVAQRDGLNQRIKTIRQHLLAGRVDLALKLTEGIY